MSDGQHGRAPAGGTVSGKQVLLVGLFLVLGVAGSAWLLRPNVPTTRDPNLQSPRLTIGTSGRPRVPAELPRPDAAAPVAAPPASEHAQP